TATGSGTRDADQHNLAGVFIFLGQDGVAVFWLTSKNASFTCATQSSSAARQDTCTGLFDGLDDGLIRLDRDAAPSLSKLNFKWLAAGSCAQFSRHETFGVQHARGPAHAEFFYSGQHASRTTRIDQHVSTRKRQGSVQVQAIAFIIGIEKNLF